MTHHPNDSAHDRAVGLALLGAIFFCAATGTGIGVFFTRPEIGGLAGAAFGLVVGLIVIPKLLRERRD